MSVTSARRGAEGKGLTRVARSRVEGFALVIYTEWLARNIMLKGLPALGYDLWRKVAWYRQRQWLPEAVLLADQSCRLREMVAYAAENSPLYARRIPAHGGRHDPADVLADVAPLTKEDLRGNLERMLAGEFRPGKPGRRRMHRQTSGGSTGVPVRVVVDKPGYAAYYAPKLLGHEWFGVAPGAREARMFSRPLQGFSLLRQRLEDIALNRILQAFFLDDGVLGAFYRRMQRFHPKLLYGYTDALYRLAVYGREHGLDGRELDLRLVLCACETLYDFKREELRRFFGCPIASEYGSSETGIIAFECSEGRLHVFTDNVFLEVLDSSGRPAAPGEAGEVFVTSLVNRAMPLIRYRLGDMVTLDSGPCACGRHMPGLRSVEGRSTDFLVDSRGKLIHPMLLIHIIKADGMDDKIRQFQFVQTDDNHLTLKLVRGPRYTPEVGAAVAARLQQLLGEAMRVELQFVDRIDPERSGKTRYFITHLAVPAAEAVGASGSCARGHNDWK